MKNELKHKLQQHRPDWDKEAFWTKLEPELPRKPKRRFPIWIWILPGLLLLCTRADKLHPDGLFPKAPIAAVQPRIPEENPGEGENKEADVSSVQHQEQALTSHPNSVSAYSGNRQLRSAHDGVIPPGENKQSTPSTPLRHAATPISADHLAKSQEELPVTAVSPTNGTEPDRIASRLQVVIYQPEYGKVSKAGLAEGWIEPTPKHRFFHQLYWTTALAARQYDAPEADLSRLTERKREEEQLRESVGLGYAIGYRHHSGLLVQAGVEIRQRRELLKWEGIVDSISMVQEVDQAYFHVGQGGELVYAAGEREVLELTRRKITQQNYFYTLDLPVRVGYQKDYRGCGWFLLAGVTSTSSIVFGVNFSDVASPYSKHKLQMPRLWHHSWV